jgi:DNA-binding transcriptional ArsR family regulator
MSRVSARARQRDAQLDSVFHALADATRRALIDRLSRGEASVSELAAPFPSSLAAISKHLDVLEKAGIVQRRRDGRFQRCQLTGEALDEAGRFIAHYRAFWESTLDGLSEFLAREDRLSEGHRSKSREPR